MNIQQVRDATFDDVPEVQAAVVRGLLAAWGDWDEIEGEFSGNILRTIVAIRAATTPCS